MTPFKAHRASTEARNRLADRIAEFNWRVTQVERQVSLGHQDPRDLDSLLDHGYVTKPVDEFRQMSIDAAKEIDANYKPRKR
jgi:hypothetical protein